MAKFKEFLFDKSYLKYSVFIAFTAALLYILFFLTKNISTVIATGSSVLTSLLSAFSPLIIGLIFAYLLSPLVQTIDNKIMTKVFFKLPTDPSKLKKMQGQRKFVSILLTFILIIAAISAVLYAFAVLIVGKFVFQGFSDIMDSVILSISSYESTITQWASKLPLEALSLEIQNVLSSIMNWFSQHVNFSQVLTIITGIGGSLFKLLLGAIVSIYLLKDSEFFKGIWRKFLHLVLPQKANAVVTETLNDINTVMSQFIRGALLDALIIAILSSVGLSFIGLEFAVFIGCFAGIANIIPYFGPFLGMVPAFLVGMFTGGLTQGILAIVILFVIQQIDCNLIYPKIVGSTTGLHPLFVLLAVSVVGYYGGIVGMILAVPMAGILQVFILKWVGDR